MTGIPRLLIVGAGTAGIPAALAALEHGAAVVLIEKTDRVGGMLWASGAVLSGAGSRLQRAAGIEDSAEAHLEEVRAAGRGRADPKLLDLATSLAGSTIDWLESIGTPFTAESPVVTGLADHHELYRTPRSYVLEAPPELGPYRGPVLAERLKAALGRWRSSDRLQLRLNTRVDRLLLSAAGAVRGCAVQTPEGPAEIAADAVVLCTGGYAGSQALMARFHPQFERLISQGLPHATGDGIGLSEAVGATVLNTDIVIPMLGAIEDPARPGFRLRDSMVGFGRPPALAGDIWINSRASRFVAEDTASPALLERALLAQPGGVMSALFDEPMRIGLTKEVGTWTKDRLGDPPDPRLLISAASLRDLAARLNLEPSVLAETVDRYNRGVEDGQDEFGRRSMPRPIETAPYHAIPTASAVIVTFAGIGVDARLRVIGPGGGPVPGLYAAGELLGGGQVQGDGFSSGMSVTPAIAFGRLAAAHAIGDLETKNA